MMHTALLECPQGLFTSNTKEGKRGNLQEPGEILVE